MEKKLIFSFLLLFMVGLVASAPPVSEVQNFPEGFAIEYPNYDYIKQGIDYKLHIHVFNSSNGYPIDNSSSSCFMHLYDELGNHIAKTIMEYETPDFETYIDGGNFSDVGVYSYIIYCYNGGVGGYAQKSFEVTYSGRPIDESRTYANIFLIIVFGLIGALSLFMANKLPAENMKDNENRVIQISWLKHLRFPCWGVSYFCVIAFIYLSGMLGLAYFGSGIGQALFFISYILMFSLLPLTVIFFFKLIDDVIADTKLRRDLKIGVERGN